MNPIFLQIGQIQIYWYSVMILIGMIIALIYILKESKKFNIDKDFIINLFVYAIPIALIGARTYFVIFHLDYYLNNLSEILAIWEGGLAIHGGIIAGLIFVIIYCKKHNQNIWRILDIADDGTIRLISAGVPLLYSLKDNKGQEKTADVIKEELINNFKQTDFTSSTGTTVKGDSLLNPEYASDIATLSYQDLSYAVYDNEDYIKVSENEKWITDNAEFSEANKKNTIADANFKKVINDWTNRKTNLFTVGTDYIITNDATKAFVFQNKDDKNDANLTTVNKWNHSLNTNSKVGLRVVVTLKKTTKFLTGTGTKLDPYVLSANVTGDMAPFKVGDYVTYTGIASYINVSSLSDSGGKNVTQTGWRVLSYNSSTKSLKLVSAGIPYYATAFNLPSITAKDYATYIKQLQFANLDIKDAAGNKLNASNSLMTKDTRIKAVEALDYDQYCNLIKLYNNREISKDMIYLNQYYWLGSYYEYKVKDVVGYRLRYVTTSADSSLAEQKTYGIRPVIELKTGFTVEAHSGTASDPHVLKY